ncbi:acyltransferase [Mucilaginibacter sp. HC2]|uniref:acyltransferase family protein n=1 Tax=Mucilaginibacter inviolabilis TaxID=2714892 RepID=UPI00140B1644|nr:acyltransferase [Mucilaginibacter inviolabilis]NHA04779.1 acyltransferase [Mucilaginibacter inviolabilis]
MKLKHIHELDGIRGIAAIMIMIFHFFQVLEVPSTHHTLLKQLQNISRFGQTGVTLFFVLSGFLITRILLSTKNHEGYFSAFYIRRSLRIFPLYYFFLVVSYFLLPILLKEPFIPFHKQWYYWVYLQNFGTTFNWGCVGPGQLWSLAVEEHFYLFWPLLIYYLNVKQIKISVWIIFALGFISRFLLIKNGYESFYFTFSNMDSLALGSLLALAELKGMNKKHYGLLFTATIIPTVILWRFVGGTGNVFIQIIKIPLIAVAYYGFIGFVVASSLKATFLNKLLTSKPLTYTGKISYGLYVYHPTLFAIFHRKHLQFNNIGLNLLFDMGSAYIIATLSYYLFEANILKFKKYFQYSSKISKERGIEVT